MDSTEFDQVALWAFVESGQRYRNSLPDESERVFAPAGPRLIGQYIQFGQVRRRQCTVRGFARRYSDEDVALLVEVDRLHDTPNGLAAKKLFERAWRVHGELRYRRLSGISVSHLYNLRKSKGL